MVVILCCPHEALAYTTHIPYVYTHRLSLDIVKKYFFKEITNVGVVSVLVGRIEGCRDTEGRAEPAEDKIHHNPVSVGGTTAEVSA